MRDFEYQVTPEDEGRKLGKVILSRLGIAESRLRSLKYRNAVLLDGKATHTNTRVVAGQMIRIVFEDEINHPVQPYTIDLDVPYKDEDLLVVNKPFGIASVVSSEPEEKTLENALFSFLGCPDDFVYRPVNRLDKGTGGLMLVAGNPNSQYRLQQLLHTDQFIRKYYAITDGIPEKAAGEINLPIMEPSRGVKRVIGEGGKESYTIYQVLKTSKSGKHALVELRLKTGRTHQIRVHLAAIGCPVHGDYLYGTADARTPGYFSLFSHCVQLQHPFTGKKLEIEAGIPLWLDKLIDE